MIANFLESLPDELIQRRKSKGWSQLRLAQKLGIAEQQIQRYERTRYRGASLKRLTEVARLLD